MAGLTMSHCQWHINASVDESHFLVWVGIDSSLKLAQASASSYVRNAASASGLWTLQAAGHPYEMLEI